MNKSLLFTLTGGVLLFVWQFMSFAALNLHGNAQTYTPKDREILQFLEGMELEEGMYALGAPSPEVRSDPAKQEVYAQKMEGRPWAMLNYQKVWSGDMTMELVRGFVMNLLMAWLLFWVLCGLKEASLLRCVLVAVAIGWVGFLYFPYSNFIWFRNPDIWAHMLDATAPFAVLGWLGHRWSN